MTRKVAVLTVCGILLYAVPSLRSYSIPTHAFTGGGGSGTDGQYEVLYTTGQASPIGVSTGGAYSLIEGLMPTILLDAEPPEDTPKSYIRCDETEPSVHIRKLQVIDPHQFCSVNVNDLFIKNIAAEKNVRRIR